MSFPEMDEMGRSIDGGPTERLRSKTENGV